MGEGGGGRGQVYPRPFSAALMHANRFQVGDTSCPMTVLAASAHAERFRLR